MMTDQTISTPLEHGLTGLPAATDPRLLVQAYQQRLRAELLAGVAERAVRPSTARRTFVGWRGVLSQIHDLVDACRPERADPTEALVLA